ncbi:hypothetical protein Nm8I071_14890 [Nonomuraea sp. TT08I-71]|nr:hypothetical protein Nm8I071_14890 [Nonomuraea sp. TT08I-71]
MTDRRQCTGAARMIALALAAPVALVGALAVATPAQAVTPTPCDDNGASRYVTRDMSLVRARSWLNPKVPYSQGYCHRNEYGDYRTDCSGFVAMAWGLGGRGNDWGTSNLDLVTTVIARGSLAPGDALLRYTGDPAENHVALFVRWADSAHTTPVVIEQTGDDSVEGTVERTWSSTKASVYVPVRYDAMVDADGISASVGDVSGDGYADLLATKPDGTLHYYANNINTNPDDRPYTSGRQIDAGWNGLNRLTSGDVNGDGYADIIGIRPDGSLWYYPNTIRSDADRPYASAVQIGGNGWNSYNRVLLGDVSGDGYADLLATKPDGTLWYYSNNITTNANGEPYTGSRQIGGNAWNSYNRVLIGDVSGDRYADLIATKPDGTLWYYSNNITTNANGEPYTGSRQIGGNAWNSYNRVLIGDVSGDRYADLLVTKSDGSLHYYPNNINSNANGEPYSGSRQIGSGWSGFNRLF